jgi:predicted RecA/RadA family phage recombinase
MAKEATFIKDGTSLNHTAAADISVGDVVPFGTEFIGVALNDIANGAVGPIGLVGVYQMAAIATDSFDIGEYLYWDDSESVLTNVAATNIPAGICVLAKASATATAMVRLGPGIPRAYVAE